MHITYYRRKFNLATNFNQYLGWNERHPYHYEGKGRNRIFLKLYERMMVDERTQVLWKKAWPQNAFWRIPFFRRSKADFESYA